MNKKLLSVLLALVLALSLCLVTAVPVGAADTPTIDGVLDEGEWGSPTFTYESVSNYIGTVNIYIMTDSDNLYIAAEAAGGDMTGAQGMGTATALNIYIDSDNSDGMPDNKDIYIIASDDGLGIPYVPPEQGWDCGTYYTYTASGAGITIAADGEYDTGNGIVEVKIPLSLLDGVGPGSTIGLCFQAFGYTKYPESAHPDWPETYADFAFPPPSSAVDLSAIVPVPPEELLGIRVDQTSISFGSITPGVPSQPRTVTVTNTGNVAEEFSASLDNISSPDVYTEGLEIDGGLVSAWSVLGVAAEGGSVTPELILTVPLETEPSTYTATLIFWVEMSP